MNAREVRSAMKDLGRIAADAAALEGELVDAYDGDLGSRPASNPEAAVAGGGVSDPTGNLVVSRDAAAARAALRSAVKAIHAAARETARARAAINAAWAHADANHPVEAQVLGPLGVSKRELEERRARVAARRSARIRQLRGGR